MSRIGDVMGEAHKNVQHVSLGLPGAPVAAVGKVLTTVGKAAKTVGKMQEDKAKNQEISDEEKARLAKIKTGLKSEVTRHVRRLNSASAGDRTAVLQSQRLIEKFGSVAEYKNAISLHPEFKRHLQSSLSSTQFKRPTTQAPWEYAGHASR